MKRKTFLSTIVLVFWAAISFGQLTGVTTYDFRDGSIIASGKTDDGSLTLSGNYSHHSENYGLNMKVDGEIRIAVTASCTFRFLGSKYSKLNVQATTVSGADLGTQNSQVTNDLSDTFDFVYDGGADTVIFKTTAGNGNDLYLPVIEVIAAQEGSTATEAVKNIIYNFDLRNGSIIPNSGDFNGNYTIEAGLFKVESGPSNAYKYNGDTHGSAFKTGNKITLKVAGNSYIKLGGCVYSNGSVTASSTTGSFAESTMATQAASEYHQEGTTLDFLYVGDAGEVVLEFTAGTTYVPVVSIVPTPFDVELTQWVQKTGTIAINGVTINYTAGATSTDAPTVTVSEGLVNSVTVDAATIRMNLAGKALSTYTPELTGDIESVTVSDDTLKLTLANAATNPTAYTIILIDNSETIEAEAGKTYTYDFANGSVFPQTSYTSLRYPTFVSADGILTMNSNTDAEAGQFGFHDAAHGAVFFPGNSINIIVAGNASVTFGTCQYGSASDAVWEFADANGTVLGSISATNIGVGAAGTSSFSYSGAKGTITATLLSPEHQTAEIYIHGMTIENSAEIVESNGKTDVWDFGAEQLDEATYNNQLTIDIINSWYSPSITAGSAGVTVPSFSAGVLSWIGGGNDRLRTTNTALTRYDENVSGVEGYTGRIYVNSGANPSRYMSIALSEDDEVTIIALSQNGAGILNFELVGDAEAQTDQAPIGSDITEVKFVAKTDGTYHIYDSQDKPSYYRFYRKDAEYATVSGTVDTESATGISENFAIVFTNEAGKSWTATMNGSSYSAQVPNGYTYSLSLSDGNGFIISNESSLAVSEVSTTHDVAITKVELYTVSGSIVGLSDNISKLSLTYAPDSSLNKIFVPNPVIDAENSTYTVELEPNCAYTITANGVNDYFIPENTLIVTAATSADITFEAKPLYGVSISAEGLNAEQLAKLGLTFTNLYEEGYVYSFSSISDIALRNGTYTINYNGLDEYPLQLGLTSNLTVDGADASKTLAFGPITNWSFDDKVIAGGTTAYNGLLFTGTVKNEIAKGHLVTKPEDTIKIPVNPNDKITVTYYYSADFSIDGGEAHSTASGSTSAFEYADYIYTGAEAGYVTLTIGSGAGTTYITNIAVGQVVNYAATVLVGADKEYKTINAALEAIAKMDRGADDRVTVMIDPGNYEEMLTITTANVTFKNAAAEPSIAITNQGVDIDANAVRITSYYGHGYNYYSMNNQKWDAEVLRVNKENGYISYVNTGSGTTNGSYWNATVVVSASGFIAENIIFENSFNQYISKKESEDVLVLWESGNKGERPTTFGSTAVQDKSFVERGAAIAITNNTDKVILNKCRVIGRQDSFYGGSGSRVVIYKGAMMGATDYLFGGMTAVFYKSDLVMNTSDVSTDRCYITAAQQSSGRGYLMYECNVKSAEPGVETASTYQSKPGYYGRPWQATTSEVVFHNTKIGTTNFPGSEGQSLIVPEGWLSSLGGESEMMYEFGTVEESGQDNMASRASWSTVLSTPTLNDGTEITTLNFTKGTDGWDPLPELIAADAVVDPTDGVNNFRESSVKVYAHENRIYLGNVKTPIGVQIYNLNGALIHTMQTDSDTSIDFASGLWIVKVTATDGLRIAKVVTR